MTSDPTQRLLTALGRFQRQFSKARNGAPQEQWSDECMNYLIQSVEIAVEQRWQDLVEALTETGRVLQTYENARRANECVPFLADSYEILCIMVGDLIVDKVRSGVIRKWRERYSQALEDLASKGLQLVRDDEDRASRRGEPESVREPEAKRTPPPLRIIEPEPVLSEAEIEEVDFELGEPPAVEVEAKEDGETEEDYVPVFAEEEVEELAAAAPEPVLELPPDEPPAVSTFEPQAPLEPTGVDVADVLDRLCDCLVRIEQEDGEGLDAVFASMYKGLQDLALRAATNGWNGSARACSSMVRICGLAERSRPARDDRFFELAYAFGGVYGDAMNRLDDIILQNWLSECDDYVAFWTERPGELIQPAPEAISEEIDESPFAMPENGDSNVTDDGVPSFDEAWGAETVEDDEDTDVVEQPEIVPVTTQLAAPVAAPAPPAQPVYVAEESPLADDPATQLLDTARKAVAHGSIGDAKLLAMQAAASIARAQASEAEARVRLAETRIQDGVKSIEESRQLVQASETSVAESESRVSECRAQLLDRGRHTQAVQSSLDGIDSRISDLERRIRELESQRDEALRQRGATLEALQEARTQEANTKGVLDRVLSEEQNARVRLEDARQRVKMLQRKQAENETSMERAREALNRQRASVADIEQTIEQIRSAEGSGGADGDDLLF